MKTRIIIVYTDDRLMDELIKFMDYKHIQYAVEKGGKDGK